MERETAWSMLSRCEYIWRQKRSLAILKVKFMSFPLLKHLYNDSKIWRGVTERVRCIMRGKGLRNSSQGFLRLSLRLDKSSKMDSFN
jgi:hypothetical protein